jgi:uncharacterized protein
MKNSMPELPDDHPVFELARQGRSAELKDALASGISPYAKQVHGQSLYGIALVGKSLPCIELLTKAGRDPNVPINKYGERPLFAAIRAKNVTLFEYLVSAGADIFARDDFGFQAIHIAAGAGIDDLVEKLISLGADIDARENQRNTPLISAARSGWAQTVSCLARHGANIEAETHNKETALILAAKAGKPVVVELLLKLGAKTDHLDSFKKTALDWAVSNKRQQCIELLQAK